MCLNIAFPNIKMRFTLLLQLNVSSLAVTVSVIKKNFMKQVHTAFS